LEGISTSLSASFGRKKILAEWSLLY